MNESMNNTFTVTKEMKVKSKTELSWAIFRALPKIAEYDV